MPEIWDARIEYRKFLADIEAGTVVVDLHDYKNWIDYDNNLPYHLGIGTLASLLEDALAEIDSLEEYEWMYKELED